MSLNRFSPNACCCQSPLECGACCAAGSPALREYLLDLGAGGLTSLGGDDDCQRCEEIAGEITVGPGAVVMGQCRWEYVEEEFCSDPCHLAPGCGNGPTKTLRVELVIATGCRWRATIRFATAASDPTCNCSSALAAVYESDVIEDCSQTPATLTKLSETNFACAGQLPHTITLTAA